MPFGKSEIKLINKTFFLSLSLSLSLSGHFNQLAMFVLQYDAWSKTFLATIAI